MLKVQYFKPSAQSVNHLSCLALTQYQLTGLTNCVSDSCPDFIGKTYTLGFHICAEGISDPLQLNDASYTSIFNCSGNTTSSDKDFISCRAADSSDISCPEGTLAVTCDLEILCANSISNPGDCSFEGFGVTDNGEYVPCPSRIR